MNNFSHKKKGNTGTVQMHVEPSPIPLIKSKNADKWDKYFVQIKFRRNTISAKSDLYELKTAWFDNGKPEELLLFVRNRIQKSTKNNIF